MTDWEQVFDRLEKKISRALAIAGNTHTLSDLKDKIRTGSLRVFHDDDAIILVEVLQYPRCRAVNFFIAAGDLQQVLRLEPIVNAWARANGCDRAYLAGRKGWERTLNEMDWHPAFRVLEKRI